MVAIARQRSSLLILRRNGSAQLVCETYVLSTTTDRSRIRGRPAPSRGTREPASAARTADSYRAASHHCREHQPGPDSQLGALPAPLVV
jgi:hypothetical protein